MPFGIEKLEWCGYPTVKKFDDMFIHFDRIHERLTADALYKYTFTFLPCITTQIMF